MERIVPIKLDKERLLKFGVQSFIAMERASGQPMTQMDFEKMESIFVMLYAGLVWEDRKLTLDGVISIVDKLVEKVADEKNLYIMDAMNEVMLEIGEKVKKAMGDKPEVNAMPSK